MNFFQYDRSHPFSSTSQFCYVNSDKIYYFQHRSLPQMNRFTFSSYIFLCKYQHAYRWRESRDKLKRKEMKIHGVAILVFLYRNKNNIGHWSYIKIFYEMWSNFSSLCHAESRKEKKINSSDCGMMWIFHLLRIKSHNQRSKSFKSKMKIKWREYPRLDVERRE